MGLSIEKFKKGLQVFIGVCCPIILLLLKVEKVKTFLESLFPDCPGLAEGAIIFLFVLSLIANYIVTGYNPEKKYQAAQEARHALLDEEANKLILKFQKKKFTIKLNVRSVGQSWRIFRLDPDKKGDGMLKFFPPIFKFEWSSSNLTESEKFILGLKQGSTGIAWAQGYKVFGLSNMGKDDKRLLLNLNKAQVESLGNIFLLVSIPIYKPVLKGRVRVNKKIGVLTMQCDSEELGTLMMKDETFLNAHPFIKAEYNKMSKLIAKTMTDFAEYYAKLDF